MAAIAYGRRIEGVEDPDGWLARRADGLELPSLQVGFGPGPGLRVVLSPARALVLAGPGEVRIDGVEVSPGGLVHPLLGACAALASRAAGGDALHGGGYVGADGRAWGVLGLNRAGKSTLIAALARAGRPVLTDDRLLVEDGCALAGPRCVDLREPAPDTVPVRWDERHRMRLGPAPVAAPLAGFVVLGWRDAPPRLEPVASRDERARVLAEHRCFWAAVPPPPTAARDPLADLPMHELWRRPDGRPALELLPG